MADNLEPEPVTPVVRRVLLVDDHPIVRDGLARMIASQPDLQVSGEADGAEDALRLVADDPPDLAVVDLFLEGMSGLDLIKLLRERRPELPVLVLSMHDESVYAERALRAGARGYVMKQVASRTILEAIRTVLRGDVFLSGNQSARSEGATGIEPDAGRRDAAVERLSDREREIFNLLGRGVTRQAIVDRLGISVKTVETHRANMKYKLNLRSTADLDRQARAWVARGEEGDGCV